MTDELSALGSDEAATKVVKGRMQISLLDDTVVAFDVESKAKGEDLYQKVNSHLKVEEAEYFGLQYYDSEGNVCWLDTQKQINKQVKEPSKVTFKFRVMFYTPDPNSLQEYTRYLFTLQVRRDLLDERLHCSEDTVALLASYIVQGELGDYDQSTHTEGYLSGFQFVPNQSPEVEAKIIKFHLSHRGKSPSEADRNMLDVARQLEMYGITLYPAKDRDDTDLSLSVFHMGIIVFQNQSKINMFSWANIRKLSFKKKKFIIKLHPGVYSADLVEFTMQSRHACKGFWKICIAHHVFFRQRAAVQKRRKSSLLSRGSKYRYSGRTQKQLMEDSRDAYRPSEDPERTRSARAHRGSDAQSPVASSTNSDVNTIPLTPPPSYSSVQTFSYPVQKPNGLSRKVSMTPSEDEGSFTLNNGSLKSSMQLGSSTEVDEDRSDFTVQNVGRLSRQDNAEQTPSYTEASTILASPDMSATALQLDEATPVHTKERVDLDIEIEQQDSSTSLLEQIKGEIGWQYHLTSPDLEEKPESPVLEVTQNGHVDREEVSENLALLEINGNEGAKTDVDENEADDVMPIEDDVIFKKKESTLQKPVEYDSDSGSSSKEQEDEVLDGELEIPRSRSDSLCSGNDEPGIIKELGKPFHMAKEILLTERTYVKDLEVITVSFRDVVTSNVDVSEALTKLMFENIDPLYDFHCSLLAELEDRVAMWEQSDNIDSQKIGDIMQRNMKQIQMYTSYIQKHDQILVELENEIKKSDDLNEACKEFELNKICYLPLNTFLLKPVQRLLYYKSILGRLYKEYSAEDPNHLEAKSAYEEVFKACKTVNKSMNNLENLHKMVELDRDLIGVEDIVHPAREFIREGCLSKICRKGPQPRMFFLFSDTLLYTAQGVTSTNQFRVRAQIPLHLMKIEEGSVELHGLNSFTIHSDCGKSFVVAATSPDERFKWMEDLKSAMVKAQEKMDCQTCKSSQSEIGLDENPGESMRSLPEEEQSKNKQPFPPPIKVKKQPRDPDSDDEGTGTIDRFSSLDRRHAHVRTMSTRRVCWHRNTSISMNEYTLSVQNNLSGELWRRFKNSSQWQKLWVVFTNFSLFFFKSTEEDEPLASLPLIGYSVSKPSDVDNIDVKWAFKLQYKNHTYFFKAESEYSFDRWMEVLSSATKSASRTRIFSRLTSA